MDEEGFNALGSLLIANNEVIDLVMQNCQLTKEKLDALGSHSGLKICTLDIRSITGMTFDLFLAISKFATESEVKELLMDPWKWFSPTTDQIMELSKWKVCGKLDVLKVSNNKDLGTAGFGKVGTVVSKCQVKELKSQNCNLTAEGIKAFKENTRNAKLNILDISLNKNLGTAGFGEVGLVVSNCEVKKLQAQDCNLTAKAIRAFKENSRNAKLEILDISYNKILGTSGFGEVGLIVSKCQVKEFRAWDCNLTAEGMKAFKENTNNAKLDILDVSWNDNLGTSGFGEVGLVVSKCQVRELGARDCNLTAEEMKAFKENTRNAKIDILSLSFNKVNKLGDEGLSTISEIVRKCQVQTLEMKYCNFNSDQLERFKALIDDTGVEFRH
uniref:ribonuclease inhibitor-like n=1 Tax=Styela clava TaxID=7725 RepID=UPI00193A5C02|nr:ribonuclease inhibitor-like [Styela clava]